MPGSPQRLHRVFGLVSLLVLLPVFNATALAQAPQSTTNTGRYGIYFPGLFSSQVSVRNPAIKRVNQIRVRAEVPMIDEDFDLDRNCFEHARYMAENNHLTHQQNPDLPYATPSGQQCAQNSNAWIGTQRLNLEWDPKDPIQGWMTSVAHRLWLIYPTMKESGYGFYISESTHLAAAAFDVLSGADFGADEAYPDWPVLYPGPNQKDIPASAYPITLNWRYFGQAPKLVDVQLTTLKGTPIAFEANTNLPAGHKGIQILPKNALPANSTFVVSVHGRYAGRSFIHTWQFSTGSETSWQLPNSADVEMLFIDEIGPPE